MRPTGRMHIGHYHGALKNWVKLQEEYECLYFAADWHVLTTHHDDTGVISESVWEMFVDWLAVGINPARATIFIQSRVPEHAELALLLGMIAPVGWLERVPVGREIKAFVLLLQPHPVLERAVVVPEMHASGRPHARQYAVSKHSCSKLQWPVAGLPQTKLSNARIRYSPALRRGSIILLRRPVASRTITTKKP